MDRVSRCCAEIRHHSSSIGRNVLHLSFKVKYCHEIFNDIQVQKRCEEIFHEVSKKHQWFLRETGFDKDHVHVTIDAETNGPADVAKALKGTSGKKLLNDFPYLKKRISGQVDSGAQQSISRQSWRKNHHRYGCVYAKPGIVKNSFNQTRTITH